MGVVRFTLNALGFELDLTFGPASPEADEGAALNGGTLATDRVPVEITATDTYMGFTNGREGCTDPEDGERR